MGGNVLSEEVDPRANETLHCHSGPPFSQRLPGWRTVTSPHQPRKSDAAPTNSVGDRLNERDSAAQLAWWAALFCVAAVTWMRYGIQPRSRMMRLPSRPSRTVCGVPAFSG